jgi:hypothetical protein
MPSRVEREGAADRALQWVVDHLPRFTAVDEDGTPASSPSKPLIELAIMAWCRHGCRGSSALPSPLVDLLRTSAAAPAVHDARVVGRVELVAQAFLYAVLAQLGHEDAQVAQRIQQAVDAGLLDATERTPHHMMEERLCLELGSFTADLPPWATLLERSVLGHTPPTAHLREVAAYQVTHVVLFLTAFGTRAPPAPIERAKVAGLLAELLVVCAADEHWDLVGELLLCWEALQLGDHAIVARSWRILLDQQSDDGSFPGPKPPTANEPTDQADRFAARYHTTLVVIMAVAAHVRDQSAGRPAPPGRHPRTASDRDAQWLAGLLDRRPADDRDRPVIAGRVLVGISACLALGSTDRSTLDSVTDRVAEQLSAVDDWIAVPAALSIAVYGLLQDRSCEVATLSSFVDVLVAALDATPATDALADLALCEKRVMLHHLGRVGGPVLAAASDVESAAAALPASPSTPDLDTLLRTVESATAHGTSSHPPVEPWVGELLAAHAAWALRRYDLPLTGRLLRSAHHLGSAAPIDVLVAQRRHSGGFGYFGAQQSAVRAAVGQRFDVDVDLLLPVTVACLQTMAEVTTSWRLCGSRRA